MQKFGVNITYSIEKAKSDFQGEEASESVGEQETIDKPSGFSSGAEDTDPPPAIDLANALPVGTAVAEKEKTATEFIAAQSQPGLNQAVLEMVTKDPFFTISEIKNEIARKHPSLKPGWWSVWSVLRKNRLLSKKNRFRRARIKIGQDNE